MPTIARVALLLPVAALLTGCVVAPPSSAPEAPDDPTPVVLETVATADLAALAESNVAAGGDGSPASVDCAGNEGVVPKIEGTVLECVATIGNEPPIRVALILGVEGDDVLIADVLDATNRDPDPATPTVPDTVIEELATQSLEQQGVDAAVLCEGGDVPIEVGHQVGCNGVLAEGGFAQVVVEVTSFDGDNYLITARVAD